MVISWCDVTDTKSPPILRVVVAGRISEAYSAAFCNRSGVTDCANASPLPSMIATNSACQ
jgi:hypothetical protein